MPRRRPTVDIRVLGPLAVHVGGVERPIRGVRQRSIVCLLAMHAGAALDADRLVEMVWDGSEPATAVRSLRVHISQLRKTLGEPGLITTVTGGYRLEVEPDAVDMHRVESLAAKGRALLADGAAASAARTLRTALAEWRGTPLHHIADLDAARERLAHLERIHDDVVVNLAAAELEVAGRAGDVAALEALVGERPYDERVWGLLMKAQYWAGRQADALATYRRAAAVLVEELGLEPGQDLRLLETQILAHDPALDLPPDRTVDLPTFATSFVGRHEQVDAVAKLVSEQRLVTITGLGGAGKTRLAVQAALAAAPSFDRGVAFASLERLDDEPLVAGQLAAAVGVDDPSVGAIAAEIGSRRMLIVLDNCEHLVGAVADLVGQLVGCCAAVTVLATSRVPLGVVGETVWPIPPLEVPAGDEDAEVTEIVAVESAALFVERARQARPGFVVDHAAAAAVSEVCRASAGVPLVIELAAARCNVLSVGDIARRLRHDRGLASRGERDRPERHHSMEAALEWTLELLAPGAQALFRRLSVFHGPVGLDAIVQVCTVDAQAPTVDSMAMLVEAALVTADVAGETATYSLLPPIRQVAAALLADHGEERDVADRHAGHFTAVAQAASRAVGGPAELEALATIDDALDDVRAALAHAARHAPVQAMEMIAALSPYWLRRRLHAEGRRWARRALADDADPPPELLAAVLHAAGSLAFDEADLDEAEMLLGRALEIRQALGDRRAQGLTLNNLAGVASDAGDHDTAYDRYLEALEVFESDGFDLGVASTTTNLGIAAHKLGHLDTAAAHLDVALVAARRIGNRSLEALALERMALVAEAGGDDEYARALTLAAHTVYVETRRTPEQARSHWNLAVRDHAAGRYGGAGRQVVAASRLALEHDLLDEWWVAGLVETAAAVAFAGGDPVLAARLVGCGAAHRERHGHDDSKATVPGLDAVISAARRAVGDDAYDEELITGGAMSARGALDEIVTRWG